MWGQFRFTAAKKKKKLNGKKWDFEKIRPKRVKRPGETWLFAGILTKTLRTRVARR